MDAPYQVRLASRADLSAIASLERQLFSDPWSVPALATALAGVAFVAEHGSTIAGYVFARVMADEAEIQNLGVHPLHRRRGVARRLVEAALRKLAAAGARTVLLEVRISNVPARETYRRLGFEEVGRRARYYRRPVEDAMLLARPIG